MSNINFHRRALLLGNGLNRISQGRRNDVSWKAMIEKLEEPFSGFTQFSEDGDLLPTLFRVQRASNLYGQKESTVKDWIETLDELEMCELHRILAKQAYLFPAIITTNYDHVLERALNIPCQVVGFDKKHGNLHRHQKNDKVAVYHPHGEVGCPDSAMYSLKFYLKEISRLIEFDKPRHLQQFNTDNPTWLDWFIHSELHICGLEFGYDELTLWHALQKRLEIRGLNTHDAFIYLFYNTEEKDWEKEASARESLFNSYGVECVNIPVYEQNYERAWRELIGTMLIKLESDNRGATGVNAPIQTLPSSPCNSAIPPKEQKDTDGVAMTLAPKSPSGFPDFRRDWRGFNVTATAKVIDNYPDRCWLNIGVEKLSSVVSKNASWIFDCLIDGNRYCYRADAARLQTALEKEVNQLENPQRYSFYIEYRTGKLYRSTCDTCAILAMEELPPPSFTDTLCKIPRKD